MNKNKISRLVFTLIMCIAMICGVCAVAGCKSQKTYYTVTFDSAGGSSVDEQIIESGEKAEKPEDPTKDGYVLDGWYTEDGKAFVFTTPITADITLTAKWTEDEKITYYKVSFDVGDHGEAPATQSVKENGKADNPGELASSSTHIFAGWYKDSECKHAFDFESEITEDTVIYAKWTKIDDTEEPPITTDTYTVTFKDGDKEIDKIKVESGKTVTPPELEDTEGFLGWYTKDGEKFETDTKITGDVTYIAKWEEETEKPPVTTDTYTVTFETNGGTLEVKKAIVESGKKVTKPDDPIKAGYVLEGWYTDEQCTTKYDFENTPVTKDITLYANWTAKSEFTVTFDCNGGTEVYDQVIQRNGTAVLPTAPTKTGYTFGGWYTDKECKTEYVFSTPVTADITLYANWTNNNSSSGGEGGDEKPSTTTDTYTYSYDAIAKKTDGTKLTQADFEGTDNSFLTVAKDKVSYRDKESSAKQNAPYCIENKQDGLSVEFKGTGTLKISFASTGSNNTSSLILLDKDGTVKAKNDDSLTKVLSDDEFGNKAGTYIIKGTTATEVTFEITTPSVYTIFCEYFYDDNGTTKSRGARIIAITMTEVVAAEA